MKDTNRRSFLRVSCALVSLATLLPRAFGLRNAIRNEPFHGGASGLSLWSVIQSGTATLTATQEPGIPPWGLGPFVRDDGADRIGAKADSVFACPISGKTIPWENKSVLCAAAVVKDKKVFLFYRAEDLSRGNSWGTSRI